MSRKRAREDDLQDKFSAPRTSSQQIELSNIIKRHHVTLREHAKTVGDEWNAWNAMKTNQQALEEYAVAMRDLAMVHWSTSDRHDDRLLYTLSRLVDYYYGAANAPPRALSALVKDEKRKYFTEHQCSMPSTIESELMFRACIGCGRDVTSLKVFEPWFSSGAHYCKLPT